MTYCTCSHASIETVCFEKQGESNKEKATRGEQQGEINKARPTTTTIIMRRTLPQTKQNFFLLCVSFIGFASWCNVVFHPSRESGMLLRPRKVEVASDVNLTSPDQQTKQRNKPQQEKTAKHHANYFTEQVPWESPLARNKTLSVYTGCSIATWTYWSRAIPSNKKLYDDCGFYNAEKGWKGRDITPETVSLLQPGDSIYVELMKLNVFGKRVLPHIKVDFVLISGQNHLAAMKPEPIKPPYWLKTFNYLTENPHVTHWFMMNLDKHAYDPFHPKVWLAHNL
jgi:hypothetical protein